MKDGDVDIVKQNFAGPNQLFLSIRTPQHRPWLAALYALDAKNANASRDPVSEFPFDEYLLRNGYLTDLMETTETDDDPEQSGFARRNRSRWIVAAVLLVILLGGSAAAYKFKSKWYRPISRMEAIASSMSTPVSTGILSLKVTRSEKDFEVSWDRLSPAVQQSSSGRLTISDGALTRTVELSGSQLREGHILYTPLFDELTFRLEVATPDQDASAESVQVLAWSGKQPADLTALAPPQPSVSNAAKPPARIPVAQPSAPPVAAGRIIATPIITGPTTVKTAKPTPAASPKTTLVTTPAVKPPASNPQQPASGQQPQPPKSSSIAETARVIPPSSPNPERPPAQQITPQAPATTPLAAAGCSTANAGAAAGPSKSGSIVFRSAFCSAFCVDHCSALAAAIVGAVIASVRASFKANYQ